MRLLFGREYRNTPSLSWSYEISRSCGERVFHSYFMTVESVLVTGLKSDGMIACHSQPNERLGSQCKKGALFIMPLLLSIPVGLRIAIAIRTN